MDKIVKIFHKIMLPTKYIFCQERPSNQRISVGGKGRSHQVERTKRNAPLPCPGCQISKAKFLFTRYSFYGHSTGLQTKPMLPRDKRSRQWPPRTSERYYFHRFSSHSITKFIHHPTN